MNAIAASASVAAPARMSVARPAGVAALPVRRAFAGAKVACKASVRVAAGKQIVAASAERKEVNFAAAASTMALVLSQAAAADAAVSPSLKNLLLSVLAGGTVLVLIATAVVGVSTFDKVVRK